MKITVNENPATAETEVIIHCKEVGEDIRKILATLRAFDKKLYGVHNGKTYLLEPGDVLYVDSVDKKTFLYTSDQVLESDLRLYELEERLAGCHFFRASKSSLINIGKIKTIMPDLGGRLEITLISGERLFVSRQYARQLKTTLGL